MRALIVGAGAVGQVYGYHLAQGGAKVTFYVKPKYEAEVRKGLTLYPLNVGTEPVRFTDYDVICDLPEARGPRSEALSYDQIYVTVASNALTSGTWLADLAAASPAATIITLQPGLDDRKKVEAIVGGDPERIVNGSISFLSYHAPLPGETRFAEPGMAYWFFPTQKSPFSGTDARVEPVLAALRAGGLPAKRVRDVIAEVAFPSAMLSAFVAALELSDWSFAQLRRDTAGLGARAAREMIAITAHELGTRPPLGPRLAARAFVFRVVTRLAPIIMPVDFEAYMRLHFTKVGEQMHGGLRAYAEHGRAASLPVVALDEMAKRLPA